MGNVLELHLDGGAWFPGETLTGILLLQLLRRTAIHEFSATLYGHEQVTVTERRGKHSTTYHESVPILTHPLIAQGSRGPLLYPGEYDAGTYTLPFEVPLPRGVPPSFSRAHLGFRSSVSYNLHATAGVPWRFDPRADLPVLVVLPPHPPRAERQRAAKPPGFAAGGTSIEAEVDMSDAPRDGLITGTVQVDTTGETRMRSVTVSLIEQASGRARGHSGASWPETISEHFFGPGDARFGAHLVFEVPVPPTASPSYEGQIVRMTHTLRFTADLAFAVNPTMAMPFRIT